MLRLSRKIATILSAATASIIAVASPAVPNKITTSSFAAFQKGLGCDWFPSATST